MPATVPVHLEVRLGRTGLLDVHDAEVRGASRPFRGLIQHLNACRVLAFQSRKRKSGSAVLMLQQPRELHRCAAFPKRRAGPFGVAMGTEEAASLVDLQLVQGRRHVHPRAAQSGDDRRHDLVEGLFPGFAADPHIGTVELPRVADRCIDNRVLTAAIRRAIRPLDDRLNLRGRNRKREHADAVDFDARDRRVQRALDKEVPGPFDANEQRLESLQFVIVGDGNPIAGHGREATGFRRCSQGVRRGSIKRSSRLVDAATRLVAKMTYSFAGVRERIRCAEARA